MTPSLEHIDGLRLIPDGKSGTIAPLNPALDNFVTTTNYVVEGWSMDDHCLYAEAALGTLEAERVLLGQALNHHVSWFEVMDEHSQNLCDIFSLMFDPRTEQPSEAFEAAVGGDSLGLDLCYVDSDDVLDHVWGPSALHTLAQHTEAGFLIVGVSGLQSDATAQQRKLARQRMKKLEAMGFVQVENSPFFFMNMAYKLKPLSKRLALPQRSREAETA